MSKEEILKKILAKHMDIITTFEFGYLGINKNLIPNFIEKGIIRKVDHGIYIDNSLLEDPYYILQKKYNCGGNDEMVIVY